MTGVAYVPAFEPKGLIIDDLLWDNEQNPTVEVGPPALTDERRLVDSALSRTSVSIEGTTAQVEILRFRYTGEWTLVGDVQFLASFGVPKAPTWIELAQSVFLGTQPMSHDERAEFNAANRPFARPLGLIPKKPRFP
jgi:hypothetical protein